MLQQSWREDERAGGRGGEIHQRQDPKGAKQVTNPYEITNMKLQIWNYKYEIKNIKLQI